MSVSRPQTLDEMREYIFTRLGYPVVNVEVDPTQVDVIVYDTIQDFTRYNYGDGTDLEYTTLIVSAGVSEYSVKDSNIEAAYDIQLADTMGGINTLFSPMHMLLYDDWVTNGNYPGGPGNGYGIGGGSGMILSNYQITMQWLEQAKMMFGKHYTVKFNSARESLIITPTPEECAIATVGLYRRADAEKLYNHPLVKKLAVARTMVQWGRHLGKYQITLPDGITMNGFELMNKGYEEEDKYLEWMRKESEPADFFVG